MIKIGIIGYSEGNGHPYSYSSIFNGFDKISMFFRSLCEGVHQSMLIYFANGAFGKMDRNSSKSDWIWRVTLQKLIEVPNRGMQQ